MVSDLIYHDERADCRQCLATEAQILDIVLGSKESLRERETEGTCLSIQMLEAVPQDSAALLSALWQQWSALFSQLPAGKAFTYQTLLDEDALCNMLRALAPRGETVQKI